MSEKFFSIFMVKEKDRKLDHGYNTLTRSSVISAIGIFLIATILDILVALLYQESAQFIEIFNAIGLLFQILLILAFLMAGGSKVFGTKMQRESFTYMNFPTWLRLVFGSLEILGAIILIIGFIEPIFTFIGSIYVIGTMISALFVHFFRVKDKHWLPAVFLLLLAVYLGIISFISGLTLI